MLSLLSLSSFCPPSTDSKTHSSSTPACHMSLPMILSISSPPRTASPYWWSSSSSMLVRNEAEEVEARNVREVLEERELKKLEEEGEGGEKEESLERSVRW